MSNLKGIIILIIIFSIFIQFGKVFLNNTQYEKIYKTTSSFFIIMVITICLFSLGKNIADIEILSQNSFDLSETNIKNEFENNLAKTIEENIHNIFYVNYTIKVKSDFKQLKIYVLAKGNDTDDDVKNYIVNNYCTSEDEVYMINENE